MPGSRRCFWGIGIQDYKFRPLLNAVADAASMQVLFEELGYETRLSCHLSNADKLNEELTHFQGKVNQDTEVIVVYIAGHGFMSNGKARLQLQDAKFIGDLTDGNSIQVADLLDHLLIRFETSITSFVLVICDFCRSVIPKESQDEMVTIPRWLSRRYATWWSTAINQPAGDGKPESGRGPFVASFIHHVQKERKISLDEMRDRVEKSVALKTKKFQRTSLCCGSLEGLDTILWKEDLSSIPSTAASSSSMLEAATSSLIRPNSSHELFPWRCVVQTQSAQRRWCLRCFGTLALVALVVCAIVAVSAMSSGDTIGKCRLGEWHDQGTCSKPCGGGVQQQERESSRECPSALRQREQRIRQCNMLACPSDCCFESVCPFQNDLLCNDTACHAFLNMSVCEFPKPGSIRFNSTVYGRPVWWKNWHRLQSWVTLLDETRMLEFTYELNASAKMPAKQAVCECLGDFSVTILQKRFLSSCIDLPP